MFAQKRTVVTIIILGCFLLSFVSEEGFLLIRSIFRRTFTSKASGKSLNSAIVSPEVHFPVSSKYVPEDDASKSIDFGMSINSNGSNLTDHFHPGLQQTLLEKVPDYLRGPASTIPVLHIMQGLGRVQQFSTLMKSLPECKPSELSIVEVPRTIKDLSAAILTRYRKPYLGGTWYPSHCRAKFKIAILVPYRNRPENLAVFVNHMHYFLQKQLQDYSIFIVNQSDTKRFNRGKLFNAGFLLSQLIYGYDCYILHDVDKIPEDTRFLYKCADQPIQMPTYYSQLSSTGTKRYFSARVYPNFLGAVTALSRNQYLNINGMTNDYWGWGGEDDELACRLLTYGYKPIFVNSTYSRFAVLRHAADAQYSGRPFPKCKLVAGYMARQGLNNTKFSVIAVVIKALYTAFELAL